MREIKRCPKCGDLPSLDLDNAWQLYYTCIPCAISADGGDTVDDARRAWNKKVKQEEKTN